MTPEEGYAMVMGFTPAGDADDITLLLANYSILEGKKVKLNLLGKGVAAIGVALPFIKTKHILKFAKWLGLEKIFLKTQKKISTKLGRLKERFKGKRPDNASVGANNVNNALRLKTQLALEEAGLLKKGGKELTETAISEARRVEIAGGRLTNPEVVEELTKIGGNIEDWAKYSTKTITLPSGQRVQVHFYMNKVTGQVSYRPWYDFKVKGKIYLEKGLQ
jgi:hypothetical protein